MEYFSGMDYIRIDIANQFGLSKKSFAERIAWVHEYEDALEELVTVADDKHQPQYLAAVMAYRDAQKNIPIGHLVGLDAAASGLAIFAVLSGCETTALNTGLIGESCNDIYEIAREKMELILGEKVNIPRKEVKSAMMPMYYGSKQKPKDIFGDGSPEYNAFYEANDLVAPGASEVLNILVESWNSYSLDHSWELPDGFTAFVPVMVQHKTKIEVDEADHACFEYLHDVNMGTKEGLSLSANTAHSLDGMICREMGRRCFYDKDRLNDVKDIINTYLNSETEEIEANERIELLANKSGFYSLVAIEYINTNTVYLFTEEYLRKILAKIESALEYKSFEIVFIHDEFKAHPNNLNKVRTTYMEIMAEIAEGDILQFLLDQVRKDKVSVCKFSSCLGALIRKGNYAIS